jgi:hypothetical protein
VRFSLGYLLTAFWFLEVSNVNLCSYQIKHYFDYILAIFKCVNAKISACSLGAFFSGLSSYSFLVLRSV